MGTPNTVLTGPVGNERVGFTWSFIGTTTARTYPVLLKAAFSFRILDMATKCASGTATATVKVDGAVVGNAYGVGPSELGIFQPANGLVPANADVTIDFTAGAVDPQITFSGARQ